METTLQQAIARRLRAIMAELGMNRRQFAAFLDLPSDSVVGNWLGKGPKANKPPEEKMILLCEKARGLTLDYIYRGVLDQVPHTLAIRLKAWGEQLPSEQEALHRAG